MLAIRLRRAGILTLSLVIGLGIVAVAPQPVRAADADLVPTASVG